MDGFSDRCLLSLADFRHRSEQYKTASEFFAQCLRQVIVSPQTVHNLLGKLALLPRKPRIVLLGLFHG